MYNIDEKGYLLGYNNQAKVVVRHRRRMPMETQDGSREWITVVECTSAGQFMLPPMIIYKGKGIYRGWTTGSTIDDAEALFAHSDKGFITDNLALEWLHRFDAWTSIRAAGAPRFLLLDSHRTHYSLQFIHYAVAQNIILMSYPGHSTHLLQLLDVALFAPL